MSENGILQVVKIRQNAENGILQVVKIRQNVGKWDFTSCENKAKCRKMGFYKL